MTLNEYQTDVRLMYIDSELEMQVNLEAMSLVDEALDDIEPEEKEEEQFARDQAL